MRDMTPVSAVSTLARAESIPVCSNNDQQERTALPGRKMSVVALTDFDRLEEYVPAWEDLARSALEPNPFYEAWMLIPALQLLGKNKSLQLVLVFAQNQARPNGPPVLCGVFPLERKPKYKGLPVSVLSLWKHPYCFLCTPLLRADRARECLSAFFDWLESDTQTSPLVEFNYVSGEGPFNQALVDCLNERLSLSFLSDLYNRALFKPGSDADQYLRAAMSREHRKDVRRRARRLSEAGHVEFVALEMGKDLHAWLEEFIQLEASGWKKEHGSIASKEEYRNYFMTVAEEAFRRGRLMMLGLKLDDQSIALKCNFLSGSGGYAFKIAYDEGHSRFSPGFLLEIENIRHLHARPEVEWMDSCAVPVHFMINRLWLDRRTIQTRLVSTGKRPGDLVVSLMPLIRWLNRKVRGISKSQTQISNNTEGEA
jgi:hypothetical protein